MATTGLLLWALYASNIASNPTSFRQTSRPGTNDAESRIGINLPTEFTPGQSPPRTGIAQIANPQIRVAAIGHNLASFQGEGTLFYRFIEEYPDLIHSTTIHSGSFAWPILDGSPTPIIVDHLLLDGRQATPTEFSTFQSPPRGDSPEPTDVYWVETSNLNVLDEESRIQIECVQVFYSELLSPKHALAAGEFTRRLSAKADSTDPLLHTNIHSHTKSVPDSKSTQLQNCSKSPIRIKLPSSSGTYWIGAPGYEWKAWGRNAPIYPQPEQVLLRRAGELNIHIEGTSSYFDSDPHFLAIYRGASQDDSPVEHWDLDGRTSFSTSSLPEGFYRIQIRATNSRGYSRLVTGTTTQLTPGDIKNVSLTLPNSAAPLASVDIRIFIRASQENRPKLSDVHIEAEYSKDGLVIPLELTNENSNYSEYSTSYPSLAPGSYKASLPELPVSWLVQLEPGENLLELEVPDYRPRRVQPYGQSSGGNISLQSLAWAAPYSTIPGKDPIQKWRKSKTISPPLDLDNIFLPSGKICFTLRSQQHGFTFLEVEVLAGQEVIQVPIQEVYTAKIGVIIDGKPAPFTHEWLEKITVTDANNIKVKPKSIELARRSNGTTSGTMRFTSPGEYHFRAPSFYGSSDLLETSAIVGPGKLPTIKFIN